MQHLNRASVLAGLTLALLPSGSAAQDEPGYDEHVRSVHAVGVFQARADELRTRWESASPEARERVTALFQDRAHPMARPGALPRAELLAEARRALDSPEPPPWPARLADALDLRVVPGAFEPADDGRGAPLTIRVTTLYDVTVSESVELSLYWISPDGAENRARSEPVVPEVWEGDGFAMYVRAPVAGPGVWRLVPEVRADSGHWRGFPVPVECIPGLRERGGEIAQRAQDEPEGIARELAPRLAAALNHGARASEGLPLADWLELALDERGRVPEGGPEPLALAGFEGGHLSGWTLSTPGRSPEGPIVVLATDHGEHPVELLTGALGQRWRALRDALDALLIVTDLPALPRGEEPMLTDLLDHLTRERTGSALILVLRREAGVLLPARLRKEGLHGVERLVLCGPPAAGAAPRLGLELPVLALDAGAAAEEPTTGGEPGAPWTWIRRPEPGFLADLAAPEAIRAWLADLDGAAGERSGR